MRIMSSFKKSELRRNFLILSSGTALSEIIPVLASPILTRLYTPEEFGVFMFYFTIAGVLSSVSMGKYETAIVLPKKNIDGTIMVNIGLVLSVLSGIFLSLIFVFFHSELLNLFNLTEIEQKPALGLIIFLMLSYNVYIVFDNWLNRVENFSLMAKGKVMQKSITIIISLAFSSLGHFALSVGRIIGQTLTAIIFWAKSRDVKWNQSGYKNAISELKRVAVEYNHFPLYLLPSSLANKFSNNIPNLLLGKYFSFDVTGYYAWSFRIIGSPMNIITSSISKLLYSKTTELNNANKSLLPIVRSTYIKMAAAATVPFLLLGVFAPEIFGFVFGKDWVIAGVYTQLLMPWLFMVFLNNPVSVIFLVLKKQKQLFRYEFVLLLARLCAFFVGALVFKSQMITIGLYSAVGFVFSLFLLFYTINLAKYSGCEMD